MGYELKKVMRLYGVETPSMARYAGVDKPAEVAALKEGATAQEQAQFAKDKAAFDEQMRRYDIDQAAFKGYTDAYGRNVGMGSIYNQGQFGFAGQQPAFETLQAPVYSAPMTDAERAAAGGTQGFDYTGFAKANLPTWFRPDIQEAAIKGLEQGVNLGDYNLTGAGKKGTLAINYGDFSIPTGFRDSRDLRAHADALKTMYDIYTGSPAPATTMSTEYTGGQTYAKGGEVKGYNRGGPEDGITERPIYDDPMLEGFARAIDRAGATQRAAANVPPPPIYDPFVEPEEDTRRSDLEALLERYMPQTDYSGDLAAARERQKAEFDAFAAMIKGQASPEADRASKAEMYFRLAAAFGAPTRTGSFGENLALASGELAEVAAGKRKSAADQRAREIELQKTRMEMAGSEVDALRSAARSGAADQRAIAEKLIEQSLEAGKPLSPEGRAAIDAGYEYGTPEFYEDVRRQIDMKIQRENAALEGQLLAQQRMSPQELTLKNETQQKILSGKQALQDLRTAYALNPNSFSGSFFDQMQYIPLSALGSQSDIVVNTGIIQNLLGQQALSKLKIAFSGNTTDNEQRILFDLEGINSKTLEERRQIMLRAFGALQDRLARDEQMLNELETGQFRLYETREE
jgi:hypothetical protein